MTHEQRAQLAVKIRDFAVWLHTSAASASDRATRDELDAMVAALREVRDRIV